jgi:preprotein translocase subunit SecA
MNKQRQAVYTMRRGLLEGKEQKERVLEMSRGVVGAIVDSMCPPDARPDTWDLTGVQTEMLSRFGARVAPQDLSGMTVAQIEEELLRRATDVYQAKEDLVGAPLLREAERNIMLHVIDDQWKDHLLSMDHLKEGIGLRGYGQKDPLVEYKKESFTLFQDMMDRIEDETVRYLYFLRFEQNAPAVPFSMSDDDEEEEEETDVELEMRRIQEQKAAEEVQRASAQAAVQDLTRGIQRQHEKELKDLQFLGTNGSSAPAQPAAAPRVGRNDPCPCGSGKKYKKCHGA